MQVAALAEGFRAIRCADGATGIPVTKGTL